MTEQSEILMLELLRQVDGKVDTLSSKVDQVITTQSAQGATLANHEARICTLEKGAESKSSSQAQAAPPSSPPATQPKAEPAQPSPWIPVIQSAVVWTARIVFFLLFLLALSVGIKEVLKIPIP